VRYTVLSLFPGMIQAFCQESIIARAAASGVIQVDTVDIRNFAHDKHRIVDDYPYGGGAGMVMKPEPVIEAIESVCAVSTEQPHVILTTPRGRVFSQQIARVLAAKQHLLIVCGHYEGVDERVCAFVDDQISIGDYVLTGGELAAAVIIEATARLVPGVISEDSTVHESFSEGILEGPQYTRPREYRQMHVPDVLLSGDHERIRLWRRKQALLKTIEQRPELICRARLGEEDLRLLEQIEREEQAERCGLGV